ncbi:uncharacterized protein [Ptychodera flava]|uniref:uncharacterized protein n=1 Tax=Ptychodera flava TaxID=63121 RepID=UPI00396A830C
MVQMFFYENRGGCCRKLITKIGCPTKILLYPYEGWAASAMHVYWTLKTKWWSRSRCKIIEVCAGKKRSTKARIYDDGNGLMFITGYFKESKMPDFELVLTSHVTKQDFQAGYILTGTLERGNKQLNDMQLTHFAMIQRK